MFKKTMFVISLTLLFCVSSVEATDYYVDSIGGNDNNSGTSPGDAWQNISKINELTLGPGDGVYLKAGSQWTGQLYPQGSGSAASPVIIDMYGTGNKPCIEGQGSVTCPLYLYNFEYIEISNLELTNQGPTRQTSRYGVWARGKNYGTVHHVHLKNLDVHDINADLTKGNEEEGCGIFFSTNGPTDTRFDGLLIEDCYLLRTDRNGIASWTGQNRRPNGYYPSINVVIRGNLIEDCGGDAIKAWGCDGCLIEYNVVDLGRQRCSDHAAGIWPFTCDDTVIQFNEVSGMKGTLDGQGFDSDYNSYYTTIQYNYSHDNEGGFLLVCSPNPKGGIHGCTGSVIRYNISQNDGVNQARVFHVSGKGVQDTYIYNNVVYIGSSQSLPMIQMGNWDGWPDNTQWYNNIFYVDGQVSYSLGSSTNNIFSNNVFYGNHTSPPYDPNAITSDPMLVNPGSGGSGINSVDGYKIQAGSPCIDAGTDTGIAYDDPHRINGGRDYWGNLLPANSSLLDIGTHERSAAPDTDPPTPDPMTWDTVPYATGSASIAMEATTASDISGVEYYFSCVSSGGHDSGWQDSTFYEDSGLSPSTQYCYTVKARDKSPNQNQTAESTTECATTNPEDTTPPTPDPMTWATVPYATGSTTISMTATTASDDSGVEYYFDCLTAGGHDSGWQDSTTYEDSGLSPETPYCYTVAARDKSPNQNQTAASSSQCATTDPAGPGLPWFDGFESGDLVAGGWMTSGSGSVQVRSQAAYNGNYGAELRGDVQMETAVDTSGFTAIHVKFMCRTKGLDTGQEYLYCDWYDGSSWHQIEATQVGDWTYFDKTCGSGADDNSSFKIRFRLNSNHPQGEYARIDDIEVTGS